jgi:hypothetical protein
MRSEDFNRDGPVEAGVAGTVELSHSARAEGADDLVWTEFGAGGQGHRSRVIIYW